jgi:dolichol-phosphate mannosyltransferase
MLGLPLRDATGGFNAWRMEGLKSIHYSTVTSRGYAFQVELKFRAHKSGLRIAQIPILFENRKFGKSKMTSDIVFEAALRVFRLRSQSR